jgi:hypothetical protein
MKKHITCLIIILLFLSLNNVYSSEASVKKEKIKKDYVSGPKVDMPLHIAVPVYSFGLWFWHGLSREPRALASVMFIGGGLNGGGTHKDTTALGLMILYNLTIANEHLQTEVFITNLAIWGAVELLYPEPEIAKNTKKKNKEQKTVFKVMPIISKDKIGLACNYRF